MSLLEDAIRQIVREELATAGITTHPGRPIPGVGGSGGANGCLLEDRRGRLCIRPRGHSNRHRYLDAPSMSHVAPERAWEPVDTILVSSTGTGARTHEMHPGHRCRVAGLGKGGGIGNGWTIVSAEARTDGTKVNVIVRHPGKGERIVPIERIFYQHQSYPG